MNTNTHSTKSEMFAEITRLRAAAKAQITGSSRRHEEVSRETKPARDFSYLSDQPTTFNQNMRVRRDFGLNLWDKDAGESRLTQGKIQPLLSSDTSQAEKDAYVAELIAAGIPYQPFTRKASPAKSLAKAPAKPAKSATKARAKSTPAGNEMMAIFAQFAATNARIEAALSKLANK